MSVSAAVDLPAVLGLAMVTSMVSIDYESVPSEVVYARLVNTAIGDR